MVRLIARIAFVSILVAFFPFVGSNFFDAPVLHGFISFDTLLVSLLFFQKGRLIGQIPLTVSAFLLAFWGDSLISYSAGFSYLAIVWIFYWLKNFPKAKLIFWGAFTLFIMIADWSLFFESSFAMSLRDLFGLARFYWWGLLLFFAIPLLQSVLAWWFFRPAIRKGAGLPLTVIIAVLGLFLGADAIFGKIQQRVAFLDFPLGSFLEQRLLPGKTSRNIYLQADIKRHFNIIHPEELRLDSIRPTVMVLVESWGVRKDFALNDSEFCLFPKEAVTLFGIRERERSYTQGAEWEDFRTPKGKGPSGLLRRYKGESYQVWYLHGYDENFYDRKTGYPPLGFDSLKFRSFFEAEGFAVCDYGFRGICDSAMLAYVDSRISEPAKKFIYWTTLDSHPPYEIQNSIATDFCRRQNLSKIECSHATRIRNTLGNIAKLVERHPEYRFIIQGDHRPMGSLSERDFVQEFYYRWVPVIVLNGK